MKPAAARLFSIASVLNAVGGSGLSGLELSYAFACRGHSVIAIAYAETQVPAGWQHPNLEFIRVDPLVLNSIPSPPTVLSAVSALISAGRQRRIDVIHAHYAVTHGEIALLGRDALRSNAGGPVAVVTCRGTDITGYGSDPGTAPGLRYVLSAVDAVTFVSKGLRSRAVRDLGVDPASAVIPNFVPSLSPPSGQARPFVRPETDVVFVHVSTFRDIKRVPWIVTAFAAASATMSPATASLVLVGDGPNRNAAWRTAVDLGVADRVICTGTLPPTDVRAVIRECDALLLASTSEGCPRAVLEGMSEGKPIVATHAEGVDEMVEDGCTGLLAPTNGLSTYAASLTRIARDPRLAQRLGAAAKEVARTRYDTDMVVSEYEELYASLLVSRSAGARS
jgi:N-acetyl-alpha-D-glucosaminyl L-malate synthase BshA